ncbi:hypothetical protein LQR31_04500 [Chromobacterium vaccinii]|uniref:hypothetical protein n=1 Tax=Chromobacterium vaccinii TaxID=1108595 RepID=UPI001E30351B|nr:hypothetical protein [Chromobacterium vaccinii]MCD4483735.1 hypothetical protein [Chromobacterium vaccinii]
MTGQEDFMIEKNSMQSALDLLTRSANILDRMVVVKKISRGGEVSKENKIYN